ncbi:MAG: thiamine pyrophosphate-binding protein, partial [Bryobacteraceae bacterium]
MTTIFGNPGSTELPFLRDMPADFRYVLGLHERSAAGMGLGYALGTRHAAFVNLHSIASVGNGLSSLVDAQLMHAPLVVTTGQQDRRHLLQEPFLVSRAVEVAKPYVKWACEPLRAEDVPAALARGYYLATLPPMGPVFISIPMDDWMHEAPNVVARSISPMGSPDPSALEEVVRALDASRKSAIVAGPQIEEDAAYSEVVSLAEHLRADVYQSPISPRWTFPRSHPQFRGSLLPAQRPLAGQLAAYDVVVVLGAPVFLYYAYLPGNTVPEGTRLFQITNSPDTAAAALAGASLVGNIAAAARYLCSHAQPGKGQAPAAPKAAAPAGSYPITPGYLFSVLNQVLPRNAIVCEECPSSKGDLDRQIVLDAPYSFYSVPNGVLGFGLPAAVGLQLA